MTTKTNDSWFCAEGEREGRPVVVRGRQFLAQLANPITHPRLLRVVWEYEVSELSGFPTRSLAERMSKFEDLIVDALEKSKVCVFFSVYTHNGRKEWRAYTSNVQSTCNIINAALPHDDPYPIKLLVEDDPDWKEYRDLLAGCDV